VGDERASLSRRKIRVEKRKKGDREVGNNGREKSKRGG